MFLIAKRKQLTSKKSSAGQNCQNVRTSSHVWMPQCQQFVVLLGITEVQLNQDLLGI